MLGGATIFVLLVQNALCLWPKGVVHFAINNKDYDIHSQDVILSTFASIEREICVKFFNTPSSRSANETQILYINNPDKRKNCPPSVYNFTAKVVDMPIGYKCVDPKNIARVVVDMLRASIEQTVPMINSFDLIRKFQQMQEDPSRPYLISATDRNYINGHYHFECNALIDVSRPESRRSGVGLSRDNREYYADKLWLLAVVMYGSDSRNDDRIKQIKFAMMTIELASCVVFQEIDPEGDLLPKNFLWFAADGADAPLLGFQEGNQTISLDAMTKGAPGHVTHTINLLFRALGIPMVSNRLDRDNYVTINWNHVEKGKEHFLEKCPMGAWVRDASLPYDFDSVTHAPANYMCRDCRRGETTVQPAQDHLWQRVLSMGHNLALSAGDKELLNILYTDECNKRYLTKDNK